MRSYRRQSATKMVHSERSISGADSCVSRFTHMTEIQARTIPALLTGRDIMAQVRSFSLVKYWRSCTVSDLPAFNMPYAGKNWWWKDVGVFDPRDRNDD